MKKVLAVLLLAAGCWCYANAQSSNVYSFNIVGYYDHAFQPGNNLFGSSLDYSNNSLSLVIPTAPTGTMVTEWDPVTLKYLPASVFNGSSWSIDYNLTPGIGALLNTPTLFTNTFIGTVLQGPGSTPGDVRGQIPPNRGSGYFLIGSDFPVVGRTFEDIIGRAPNNGEYATILDAITQTYSTSHFINGAWDNGDPTLGIGDAAFYNLGPVAVPEPAALSLIGLGVAVVALRRRASKK